MSNKSQLSSIGPSSQRSPSSPLPADALEYFSETAARMGSSGASGMMIQSPDGRPAGIFFQPKPSSSLGSRTPGSSLSTRRTSGDEKFASAVAANQSRVLKGIGSGTSNSPNSSSGHANSSNDVASLLGKDDSESREMQALPSPNRKPALKAQIPNVNQADDDEQASTSSPHPAVSPTILSPPLSATEANVGASARIAKQTYASSGQTVPAAAMSRPSAQPQAGLLIGAGFTPSSRRGGGPKKIATNMEILPPIKVLIVEDNVINVNILSKFLKQRKIQFGVAKNGREAVEQWQTGGYHLILMDIQLPVMDGIEATKEIRRLEREANIGPINSTTPPALAPTEVKKNKSLQLPSATICNGVESDRNGVPVSPSTMLNTIRASVIIVALTASILNSDRVAALAAGCNDFLNKPVNLRWLERKVIEWGSMQYLIGFRDINDDLRRQKRHQSLTDREVCKSNGLVQEGFGTGPNKLAKEMAGRLHIGARKVR